MKKEIRKTIHELKENSKSLREFVYRIVEYIERFGEDDTIDMLTLYDLLMAIIEVNQSKKSYWVND